MKIFLTVKDSANTVDYWFDHNGSRLQFSQCTYRQDSVTTQQVVDAISTLVGSHGVEVVWRPSLMGEYPHSVRILAELEKAVAITLGTSVRVGQAQ